MRWLLDTNAVLYFLDGRLAAPLPAGEYFLSVISEMELLSFPALDDVGEANIRSFLANVSVVGLTRQIKEAAILMRRQTGLRLPDAIVAATAVVLNLELLTNDHKLLQTPGLCATSLPLKQSN